MEQDGSPSRRAQYRHALPGFAQPAGTPPALPGGEGEVGDAADLAAAECFALLLEPDGQDRAETIARDHKIVELLRRSDFTGPDWEIFIARIVRYGTRVLHKLILDETVFVRCSQLGRPVGNSMQKLLLKEDSGARDDLVVEVVTQATFKFLESALRGGSWDPVRGASLRTYFVGTMVSVFANEFRKWAGERKKLELQQPYSHDGQSSAGMMARPQPDPLRHAVTNDQIHRALHGEDTSIQIIAEMIKLQFPWAEIAYAIGTSIGAAQERWRRFCERQRPDDNETLEGGRS